ncbi:hypothetical protein [Acinetobacter bereziniae]|uniref:hypothetical protein n=1 Tax=Acinetobacter bereziniae TaxID=106648 RepID=UPI003AF77057
MQNFLLIVLITLGGCTTNNNKNAQFEVERLNYIAGCSESGEFDENTCKCSFDYLVENFKTDFYKDPEVLDETSQKYSEFVMHSKKAYQLCIKE